MVNPALRTPDRKRLRGVHAKVIRNTNFRNDGFIDWSDIAELDVEEKQFQSRELEYGDIIVEKSGGGPTQPVGRIGFISGRLPNHWFSNFVQLLRPDSTKIDPEFLGWLLLELNRSGLVERLQHQTTQMRNLDFRDYLRIFLPDDVFIQFGDNLPRREGLHHNSSTMI
jgi:type I restriction enzyme S subunit